MQIKPPEKATPFRTDSGQKWPESVQKSQFENRAVPETRPNPLFRRWLRVVGRRPRRRAWGTRAAAAAAAALEKSVCARVSQLYACDMSAGQPSGAAAAPQDLAALLDIAGAVTDVSSLPAVGVAAESDLDAAVGALERLGPWPRPPLPTLTAATSGQCCAAIAATVHFL